MVMSVWFRATVVNAAASLPGGGSGTSVDAILSAVANDPARNGLGGCR
jgi:hypothetical protein